MWGMKGCFLLQRKYAWIAHALAVNLKKNHGITEFCGYVQSRKAERFLRAQKDIKYTDLLIDEDVHARYKDEPFDLAYIKKIEREYGEPNLWKFITVDRTIMMRIPPNEYAFRPNPLYSHEEMLRLLQVKFKAIISFLEKEKPDFLVMSAVASMGTRILYHVAKKIGVRTITIDPSRVKNLVSLSDHYLNMTGVQTIFDQLQQKKHHSNHLDEARSFLQEFRKSHISYAPLLANFNPLKRFAFLLPWNAIKSLWWLIRLCGQHLRGMHNNDYAEETPWGIIKTRIQRKIRGFIGYKDLYEVPNFKEDFAYFQLHFEPELAIMLYAPSWPDQIEVVRHIARSLPTHFKLYVREHRAMVNYRTRAFYKELKKISNVKLISPSVDLFTLLPAAKLVTVITSTAGWEATLLGKPVITFGDVFFNAISSVKKCTNVETLPALVQSQLHNKTNNDQELIHYLAAIFEESVPVDYHHLWEEESDFEKIKENSGIKNLAGLLAKKLEK
ncbi:MAG: hypothetical protein Q8R26_02140 [bacterium]|nr:hypothetical protein [bacterium]